jgi:hypothetical protein
MVRRLTAGWSTIALFTLVGLCIVLAVVSGRPYRWQRLLPVFPTVMAVLMTMAVPPAGMRLAGQRAPADAFAWTVVVVTVVQVLLTGGLAPLVAQAMWRMPEGVSAADWSVSVEATPHLIARVTPSSGGLVILWEELARRAALAAMPALLGVVGWQLGTLFGAGWLRVALAWCALSFSLVAAAPFSYSRWWLPVLSVSLLAIGLTAAARLFSPARDQRAFTR